MAFGWFLDRFAEKRVWSSKSCILGSGQAKNLLKITKLNLRMS